MNFYEHHIGDWDSATAHLSLLEEALYGRLIRLYYRTERPIPGDLGQACRLVRAANKQERDAVRTVLEEFFSLTPDGWRQHRCDAEITRYREKCDKAGRSAKARWKGNGAHTEGNADGMRTHSERTADAVPTQSEGNANHYPVTTTHSQVCEFGEEGARNAPRPRSAAERHRASVAIADDYARKAIAAELAGGIQRTDAQPVSPGMDEPVVDPGRIRAAVG